MAFTAAAVASASAAFHHAFPQPPTFETKEQERESLKDRLARACRIFAFRRYNDNAAGIVTVRDPVNRDAYWVNPSDTHWSLIQPTDLLLVDQHGAILPGSGHSLLFDKDAFLSHCAIHLARPDVLCVARADSPHGKVFSIFGKELDPITQDSCTFYKDNVVYDGEVSGAAAALGSRKVLILKNKGFLVATPSIESALYFSITFEKCCQVQILADAAAQGRRLGPTHEIGDEEAHNTWKKVGAETTGFFSAWPEYQALEVREARRARVL